MDKKKLLSWPVYASRITVNAFVVTISLLVSLIFLIGCYDYLKNFESNRCKMTYMMPPTYEKINTSLDKDYPRYNLYKYIEMEASDTVKFGSKNSIPVLFLPGSSGSHEQVRSLASVCLYKALDDETPFYFDFYTIDFNQEISGVYGYLLKEQQAFTRSALEKIASLYDFDQKVIVLGHSMGGVIAKSLHNAKDPSPFISTIISLASPHLSPVLILDPELDLFYHRIKSNWTSLKENNDETGVLISIAGGDRDVIMPFKLTRWLHNDIHVLANGIPDLWASTDHLSIMWCNQLMKILARCLFDSVIHVKRFHYYTFTSDATKLKKIFHYHLSKKSNGKSVYEAHGREIEFPRPGNFTEWNEILKRQYCIQPQKRLTTYLMIPMRLLQQSCDDKEAQKKCKAFFSNSNLGSADWIYGCVSQSFSGHIRYCEKGENLSWKGLLVPNGKRPRKLISLSLYKIRKYSHIVVKMTPSDFKTCILLEVYHEKDRIVMMKSRQEIPEGDMYYNFQIPTHGIWPKLFAWKIEVQHSGKSQENKCKIPTTALIEFREDNISDYKFLTEKKFMIRSRDWSAKDTRLNIILEPRCHHVVKMSVAYIESAGQLFRTYIRILPSFIVSTIFLTLSFQDGDEWSSMHYILLNNAFNLVVVPSFVNVILLSIIPNDWPNMLEPSEFSFFVLLFCYMAAYSILLAISSLIWYTIVMSGKGLNLIITTLISSRLGAYFSLSLYEKAQDLAIDLIFSRFPFTISILLVSLSVSTCGALGFLCLTLLSLFKIFKYYEDLLMSVWQGKLDEVKSCLNSANFVFVTTLFWMCLSLFSIPSLMHWIKSTDYRDEYRWDLNQYLCLITTPTVSVFWQNFSPTFSPSLWKLLRIISYMNGSLAVVYGTHRLYVLSVLISLNLVTLAFCELVSVCTAKPTSTEDSDNSQNVNEETERSSQ